MFYQGDELVCFLSQVRLGEYDAEWFGRQMGFSLLENYIFIKVAGCCFSGGPVAAAVINRTVLFM